MNSVLRKYINCLIIIIYINNFTFRSNHDDDNVIISHYTVYITELRNTYQTSQQPVTDDETTLHKFCVKLETVLRHEQKGESLSDPSLISSHMTDTADLPTSKMCKSGDPAKKPRKTWRLGPQTWRFPKYV